MERVMVILGVFILAISCREKTPFEPPQLNVDLEIQLTTVPAGFDPIQFPEDNSFSLERWKLGKRLFYDPALSSDFSISCASCHKQNLAFADDQAISPGVEGRLGFRNSPSLANVGYLPYLMREGGVPDLERQILVPIQEHAEFDFNVLALSERLAEDSSYVNQSFRAYDRTIDAFVITRAISVFERTLISGNSPYDQFTHQGKEGALTEQQQRGMELFFSDRTNCSNCHTGFNFTNSGFFNNGLYEEYDDVGRMRLTTNPEDEALFKVPSLRNVALTAPYMHDGSIATLADVIQHYNSGGLAHPHKSDLIRPLGLSDEEILSLLDFLQSLTDQEFIENENFKEDE